MNPLDEVEWHMEGLFIQVDSVEVLSPSRLTYMFPHNTGINAHSLPYAPGSFSNPSPPPTFASSDRPQADSSRLQQPLSPPFDLHHREVTKWKHRLTDLGTSS